MKKRRGARVVAVTLLAAISCGSPSAAAPPYAPEIERLAEILGALQFLTELCDNDTAPWREEMQGLMGVLEPDDEWQLRLSDRFNLGYASFAATYRQCTAAARLAIDRHRGEGAEISAAIAEEFGAAEDLIVPPAAGDP